MRREEQEKEKNLKEKMRAISRLLRVFAKAKVKMQALEDQKIYIRTTSALKNGVKGLSGTLLEQLSPEELKDIDKEYIIANIIMLRFTLKQKIGKSAKKTFIILEARLCDELKTRGIPTDTPSLQSHYNEFSADIKKAHITMFQKGTSMAGRGHRL